MVLISSGSLMVTVGFFVLVALTALRCLLCSKISFVPSLVNSVLSDDAFRRRILGLSPVSSSILYVHPTTTSPFLRSPVSRLMVCSLAISSMPFSPSTAR